MPGSSLLTPPIMNSQPVRKIVIRKQYLSQINNCVSRQLLNLPVKKLNDCLSISVGSSLTAKAVSTIGYIPSQGIWSIVRTQTSKSTSERSIIACKMCTLIQNDYLWQHPYKIAEDTRVKLHAQCTRPLRSGFKWEFSGRHEEEGCWKNTHLHKLGYLPKRMVYCMRATLQEKDITGVIEQRSAAFESLELLEWPRVCQGVASFAATALGKEKLQVMEMPATKEASEALIGATSAGVELISLLGGPFEFASLDTPKVKSGIVRARKSVVLSGQEVLSVALLLQIAQTVRRSINTTVQDFRKRQDTLQPLLDLVNPLVTHPELVKAIWNVIDETGSVKDSASPELRRARIHERTLEQRLQELLNKLTRENSGSNSQVQEAVNVDGRMCLVVASDNCSQVSGLLLRSGSGATMYVEPAAAVPLNNKLAEARADVLRTEYNVLSRLTDQLRPYLDDIQFCLNIIVQLDVVMARARYSTWLGAMKPTFIDDNAQDPVTLQLQRARHPLLVQQHREALRKAKTRLNSKSRIAENVRYVRHHWFTDEQEEVNISCICPQITSWLLAQQFTKQSLGRLRARAGTTIAAVEEMEATSAAAEADVAELEESAPIPIDVRVSSATKVVAITGPNTGGKTATIKTVGLAALMAKSGLYVLASEPVLLPWFDAVLADIGDEQSLSQSLSTFSGHLQRIKMEVMVRNLLSYIYKVTTADLICCLYLGRIKAESTGRSLVLLDEVGAGTDPTEGAALGMALLESFAESGPGGSFLTMATTHHGELKTLKYSDSRFENASVEFSEEKLRPTYKLLWGIPGRSNALNIAERLGLPRDIVKTARSLHGVASAELSEVIMELEEARRNYDQDLAEADAQLLEAKRMFNELTAAWMRMQEHERTLELEKADRVAAAASAARSKLNELARNVKGTSPTPSLLFSSDKSTASRGTPQVSKDTKSACSAEQKAISSCSGQGLEDALPKVGDMVYVPKLGRNLKVVEPPSSAKEITVQSGFLQVKVKLGEIEWQGRGQS